MAAALQSWRHQRTLQHYNHARTLQHGRAGTVGADNKGISGVGAGLRTTTLSLVRGNVATPANASALPPTYLAVSLENQVVFSTDSTTTAAAVVAKTAAHRAQELAELAK